MGFRDDLLTDLDRVFLNASEFAETATFVRGGEERTIRVLVDREVDPERFTLPGDEAIYITAATSDVDGIEAGDRFVLGTDEYIVTAFSDRGDVTEIVAGRA